MLRKITGILILAGLFGACKQTSATTQNGKFVPPRDGLIRKAQADRYIKVSIALYQALQKQAEEIKTFKEKYKLSESMEELSMADYIKKHPEVKAAWDSIINKWQATEDSIYKAEGMSQDEFNWIAGALINPKNKPMKDYIQRKLKEANALPEEEGAKGKEEKDK